MQRAPKKILFLIPTLGGGGAERVMVTLLKHLDRSRFRLALAVVDIRNAVYLKDIPPDVEFIDLGCLRVRYALPKIIALIWKRRPDVVFCTLGHINLALAIVRNLLPNGVRTIARETSIVSENLSAYSSPSIWALLYRIFYHRHDLLVCQSRYMQDDLVGQFGFPPERSIVINNPVDTKQIRKLANTTLDNVDIASDSLLLVAAGRLSKVKGFDLLIEAMALLDRSPVPQPKALHLCIMGDGELFDELMQLAIIKGVSDKVSFVGFQSNPYAWFARADAFVLSSRHEGFPNVVLEALTCGTPVIATPAPGGTREILDDVDGCMVAGEITAAALAEAILEWLARPRCRISESAVEPYELARIISQYEDLFLIEEITIT